LTDKNNRSNNCVPLFLLLDNTSLKRAMVSSRDAHNARGIVRNKRKRITVRDHQTVGDERNWIDR